MIVREKDEEIYMGHFLDVPVDLLERKVLSSGRIIDSTDDRRVGAYTLEVEPRDEYLNSLLATLDVCKMVINNRHVFPADQVNTAEKLRRETLTNIEKRKKLLGDKI